MHSYHDNYWQGNFKEACIIYSTEVHLQCSCIALHSMSESPVDQGNLICILLSTQQSWYYLETSRAPQPHHEGRQYNQVHIHMSQQNWMQRPYGSHFQTTLRWWLLQVWIQGTNRHRVLVVVVCCMLHDACSLNSRPMMTNILIITWTQWIGSLYRERECWEAWKKSINNNRNSGNVWKTYRIYSACLSQKVYIEPIDSENPFLPIYYWI